MEPRALIAPGEREQGAQFQVPWACPVEDLLPQIGSKEGHPTELPLVREFRCDAGVAREPRRHRMAD